MDELNRLLLRLQLTEQPQKGRRQKEEEWSEWEERPDLFKATSCRA